MTTDEGGLHVALLARPTEDCPATDFATDAPVVGFAPGRDGNAPQFVVEGSVDLADRPAVEPVVRSDRTVVCRVPALSEASPEPCGHERCLARGAGFLPVQPYAHRWTGRGLRMEVAVTDRAAVGDCVERLRATGFEARTLRIASGAPGTDAPTAAVDLGELTRRQREAAAAAVATDFFDSDGAGVDALARELDVAPATASEHLRAVQATVFGQLFPDNR